MKRHSIANKIMMMITTTSVFLGTVIITAGAAMIYNTTEDGIRSEVRTAAKTFGNIYNASYDGDLLYDGSVVSVGGVEISEQSFNELTGIISCEDDVDFTLFYNDTRVLTSVQNDDGTLAVGTKAAAEVAETVIRDGVEYLYPRVLVNNDYYMGCYIPIKSRSGETQGMIFAGKPLDHAEATAENAVYSFIALALLTLLISLSICLFSLRSIGANIADLKQFLSTLAEGDFSAKLDTKTVRRNDDIGELANYMIQVRKNLKNMVELDPLTQLFNRRGCKKKLEYFSENRMSYSVVMGDIDFFKKINDTYGHAAGDFVLTNVSTILKKCATEHSGLAARWGGEEFLLVFPDLGLIETKAIVDDLLREIRNRSYSFDGSDIAVTMTFGISHSENGEKDDLAINRADKLLYDGKTSGRNKVMV